MMGVAEVAQERRDHDCHPAHTPDHCVLLSRFGPVKGDAICLVHERGVANVVALGEPGTPVTCWALLEPTVSARVATNTACITIRLPSFGPRLCASLLF